MSHDEADSARAGAWSSYWASGALHSCGGSYADNYEGVIADFWRARFSAMAPGSKLLDLASGNGALPKMLWELVDRRWPLSVTAVDLAQVSPEWYRPEVHLGISFHTGVSMEKLPFADRYFDLVTSQYGVEYAAWPQALNEAMRVRKPQGVLALVMHHADSVLMRVGREDLSHQRLLLADDGLLACAENALPWLARARAGDVAASSSQAAKLARARYNHAMTTISATIDTAEVPDLLLQVRESVHSALGAGAIDLSGGLGHIARMRRAIELAMLRTEEMLGCGLTVAKVHDCAEIIRSIAPDCEVVVQEIQAEQGVLGWSLLASRAGA